VKWLRNSDYKLLPMLEKLARAGTARAPRSAETWLKRGEFHLLLGAAGEAGFCFDRASAEARGRVPAQIALARGLLDLSQRDRALGELEQLVAESPTDGEARRLKLRALLAMRRYAEAQAMIEAGEPADGAIGGLLAMYDALGTPPENLRERCEEVLAVRPLDSDAHYFKAIALARLGRADDARAIMALAALVQLFVPPPPDGYESAAAFRAALADEILRNPTLASDPRYRSTRNGRQAANLLQPDGTAIVALIAQIENAVDAYVAERPGFPAPAAAELVPWGVVLGSAGFQCPHRHASGWLSGVFYVAAPKTPGTDRYPGHLVLGPPGDDPDCPSKCWGRMEIEPVPGTLLLFPSYVPHGTEPSGIDEDRISVAFDIIPAQAA
jgi:hypothetical protein